MDRDQALVTERGGRLLLVTDRGAEEVAIDMPDLFVGSEAGLMGMALDGDTLYLCHASQVAGTARDVRVTRWTLAADRTEATADGVVVDGIPITSGRHSGCRLRVVEDVIVGDEGSPLPQVLLVGTGDAADEANPQDTSSLGGKVLAVTPEGDPVREDGWVEGGDPRVLTYGHRNVQGLALDAEGGSIWSVEHGPDVDDEVNLLQPGANYGWAPGAGYVEGVPMSDLERFPEAVEAAWSSGNPTEATSGGVVLGPEWGAWEGDLLVAKLKGSGVLHLDVEDRAIVGEEVLPELEGTHGRLRSLSLAEDGSVWVTTSNGTDDEILRIVPQG